MRILLAVRAFLRVLFNAAVAERVAAALQAPLSPSVEKAASAPVQSPEKKPSMPRPPRSDALTLLAALQREARLVDIVKEPLESYSDQQIGAAARDVLRNCGKVLDRFFALEPVLNEPDGAVVEAPAGFDAERLRIVGNITGEPPYRGQLVHHGWLATKCDLPQWNGAKSGERVVAAAEIEIA